MLELVSEKAVAEVVSDCEGVCVGVALAVRVAEDVDESDALADMVGSGLLNDSPVAEAKAETDEEDDADGIFDWVTSDR